MEKLKLREVGKEKKGRKRKKRKIKERKRKETYLQSQSWKAPQKHFNPSRFHLISEEIEN